MDQAVNVSRRAFLRGRSVPHENQGEAHTAVIGEACMARQNVVCRSCADSCEVSAIRFRPRLGGAALPELANALCTGCGECLNVCPAAAIVMKPIPKESA